MTISIYANVRKEPENAPEPRQWIAFVDAINSNTWESPSGSMRIAYADSHPEALQAAHKLRADLERELMDEIHAERTARRKPEPQPDLHTMEPTA